MTDERPGRDLFVLTGPTAVGKTEVAVEVAGRLGAEIVSADSMQIYRRMEIGTAKPTSEQRARVPHHLVDFVDPAAEFTVADYRAAALRALDGLIAGGRTPLLVGGTRLYIKSLIGPFVSGPAPDPELRSRLSAEPSEELHRRLSEADPDSAAQLHPADRKRITRALEVYLQSGLRLSELQRESRARGGAYRGRLVALIRQRDELYRRVDARVDEMIAAGLEDEVRDFLAEGLGPERIAMQAHGYKEIMGHLLGQYDRAEAIRLLKRNTRRYVKYQLIWLRGESRLTWVDTARPISQVVDECVGIFRRMLNP